MVLNAENENVGLPNPSVAVSVATFGCFLSP